MGRRRTVSSFILKSTRGTLYHTYTSYSQYCPDSQWTEVPYEVGIILRTVLNYKRDLCPLLRVHMSCKSLLLARRRSHQMDLVVRVSGLGFRDKVLGV